MTTTENPAIGQSIDSQRHPHQLSGGRLRRADRRAGARLRPGCDRLRELAAGAAGAGRELHCYAPDMVGFGYSDRPEDVEYGLQTWADQTVGFMKAMGIEKAHLVGNSFGGAIALRIATEHPELIDKIVLMGSMGVHFDITDGLDTVWGYEGTDRVDAQGARLLRLLARSGERGTGPGPVQGQHGTRLPGVVLVDVPGAAAALGRRHVHRRGRDPGKLPNRTLIVHGREDKVIPLETSLKLERVASTTPTCRCSRTAGTGR